MSFHTLSFASHVLGCGDINRNLYKARLSPALAIPPSSTLLLVDETGKFPESKKGPGSNAPSRSSDNPGSVLGRSNTVGILGGVSADSTLSFLRKLVNWSSSDGESSLPFVLYSDPVLNKEILSHDRSYFPSLSSKSECTKFDPTPIVENLQNKRALLENSGACCIVMPCNILHSWHDEVSKGCSVPFLNMAEAVARELKEAKLKPLEAGSRLRIGVLATDATLTAGFYQEKLQNEGFEVVLPDKATMDHAVIPAIEALNRKDREGACNLLRIALQVLLVRAVNSVILASDDMRDLLPQDDPLLKKCIDPMDALARSTIKWAQSAEKGT
ncbi:Aspartate racemase [Morella rubra]|uniref:Aspartate racemase n=1 Tax=Morella rubra TaxID=262757 RepID=A0A6A1W7B4_9ROSI|nr:Aspartate racemase [Morella rubra]KAB1218670.1 Aspartate racemase [Morella rubra]